MTAGPWVDRAYVGVLPDFSKFLRETESGITRSLGGLQSQVDRIGDGIERRFDTLAGEVVRHLDRIGDANPFTGLRSDAERAGEQIEEAFDEAQRDADESLRDIGGPGQFAGVERQARAAGNSVERSFRGMRIASVAHFGALRVAAVGAGAGIAAGLGIATVAAATMGIKTAASLEQAQISFEELLGSGKQAQAFLQDLSDFAAKTPFELPGLISNARQLLGAGQAAKDVIPILQDLGDATGALGLDQEQFNRIMLATTQSMNKGKLQGEELMQFTEAGIPIWRELARALGEPIPKLQEMSQKGELLSKDVLPKLFDQLHKDYGGAMVRQSTTLNGLWSTFMDTINIGLASTIKPFENELKGGLKAAIDIATRGFQALPRWVGEAMAALDRADVGGRLTAIGTGIADAVRPWAKSIIIGLKTGIREGEWGPFVDTLGVAITTAVGNFAAAIPGQPVIDAIAEGMRTGNWGPLGEALGAHAAELVGHLADALAAIDWFSVGQRVGQNAIPFAVGFADKFFSGLIDSFREHPFETILAVTLLGKFGGAIAQVVEKIPIVGPFVAMLLRSGERLFKPATDFAEGIVRRIFGGLVEGISRYFPRVGGLLEGGLRGILARLRGQGDELAEAGGSIIRRFGAGMAEEGALVLRNLGQFVGFLTRPFRGAGRWLVREGGDLLGGLGRGIRSRFPNIGADIRIVIDDLLVKPFGTALRWLTAPGRWLVRGLLNGIEAMRSAVSGIVRAVVRWLVEGIKDLLGIGSPSRVMVSIGRDVVRGLISGLLSMLGALGAAVRSIIRAITGRFVGARTWLVEAGKNVLRGLLDGLQRQWAAVMAWFGTIPGWIKAHKGPLDLDRRLLVPAGEAIMGGFLRGLKSGASDAVGFVKGIVGSIWDSVMSAWDTGAGAWKKLTSGIGGLVNLAGLMARGLSPAEAWIIQHESGGRTTADNPTSTAFGLGQLLLANRQRIGGILGFSPSTTDFGQQLAMFRYYYRERYGTAEAAKSFWESHGWYDQGGYLKPGFTPSWNFTGQPERVLDPGETRIWEALERSLIVGRTGPAAPPTPTITVMAGAVQIDARGATPAAAPAIRASVEDGLYQVLREFRTGSRR